MAKQPSLGTALLPPHGDGPRKGGLNKACLNPTLPAYRSWLGIQFSGQTQGKNYKRRLRMQFGAWNVRTLMDTRNNNRPQRMTAIVAHELGRYNIDIAALSETRLAGAGALAEVGAGYTFFWSGKAVDDVREAGVGFAVRSAIVPKLDALPKGISDRLMTLRLPLTRGNHLTLISAYAPTMTYSDEKKEEFYHALREVIRAVPKRDKLLLMGDFNARIGKGRNAWPSVIGPHGVGKMNSNGELLLTLCSEMGLTITNTIFQQPDIHKVT